ncbi:hypothetical protein KGM_214082 [Danaus plexippus plexippus]|uniref:Uncharacterized protein n=1 Tax=Danaus plexippus plexippus TaxID=278856 RepID=A0A212EY07_DANPL|nr:hypothetical protein KGM_214082 [Danaus plexippus plexippus]
MQEGDAGRHSPPRQREPINLKNEAASGCKKTTRPGSKGPHDCAERLNIHRFVRGLRKKHPNDSSRPIAVLPSYRGTGATYLLQNL